MITKIFGFRTTATEVAGTDGGFLAVCRYVTFSRGFLAVHSGIDVLVHSDELACCQTAVADLTLKLNPQTQAIFYHSQLSQPVRRFTAEYLETTREGMWEDSRDALTDLALDSRERVLDVGAGTGELTSVLREQAGEVIAVDADPALLSHTSDPRAIGDATRLPFADNSADLVVCQALLVNLPDPVAALEEFARVSSDRVAVIEPDNSAVTIESTVDTESALASQARELYVDGVETDVTVGDASELFAEAGLTEISVRQYDHRRTVEPPYSKQALEGARRKATGAGLDSDRAEILSGETTVETFDELREQWRAMGRNVIEQMQDERYRREEIIPFYVTTGRGETTAQMETADRDS